MKSYSTLSVAFSVFAALSQAGPVAVKAARGNSQMPDPAGFQNPTPYSSQGGKAMCVSGLVPVTVSTNSNIKLNFDLPQNQSQVTEAFLDMFSAGSTFAEQLAGGSATVGGNYSIGASYCTPVNNTKPSSVQILTPGIGFARDYWDYAPGYSYADFAAENGYATFLYDRLGNGNSTKPQDGIQTVQGSLHVAILTYLATQLRQGHLAGTFDKVIGVGHSFGSIITQGVTRNNPDLFDGVILTGFSTNFTGVPVTILGAGFAIASEVQPDRFNGLPNSYLLTDTMLGDQVGFFREPGYEPQLLTSYESVKVPVTFGELFSQATTSGIAKAYNKPLAVVNGGNDLPFCDGNCSYPTSQAANVRAALYPSLNNTSFGSYLAPGSGHALNLHYASAGAFAYIQNFLTTHGL